MSELPPRLLSQQHNVALFYPAGDNITATTIILEAEIDIY